MRKKLCYDVADSANYEVNTFEKLFNFLETSSNEIETSHRNKQVHRRIPDGNFVPVTGQDSTRVYLSLKPTRDYCSEVYIYFLVFMNIFMGHGEINIFEK